MTTIQQLFEMCQYAIENGHAGATIMARDTKTQQDIEFNDLVVIEGGYAILTITPNNGTPLQR